MTKNVVIQDITSHNELSSDHVPVIVNLNLRPTYNEYKSKISTDWELFTKTLHQSIEKIKIPTTKNEIEQEVSNFTNKIRKAIDQNSKTVNSTPSNKLDLPRSIQNQIKWKNNARKRWQATRTIADKITYKKLEHEVRTALKEIKDQQW